MFSLILLLFLLFNIPIFWYSFIVLSLHTHANRELKLLTDNTGGLAEINMSDKTSRLEGQLRTGKQFHAELPDVPRRAAYTSATPLHVQPSYVQSLYVQSL